MYRLKYYPNDIIMILNCHDFATGKLYYIKRIYDDGSLRLLFPIDRGASCPTSVKRTEIILYRRPLINRWLQFKDFLKRRFK